MTPEPTIRSVKPPMEVSKTSQAEARRGAMCRLVLSMTCLVALGACMDGANPTSDAPKAIPVSASAAPGAAFMSPYDAGVIFADACLIRGPFFENAVEGLRVHSMTQSASSGTYFHNTKNLSVKATKVSCSLVFASKASVDTTVAELARGTASVVRTPPKGISVTSRVASDGLRYFRLGIKSPVGRAS